MIKIITSSLLLLSLVSCASGEKYNQAMLEKYPSCYHINKKIYDKCIKDNEAGKKTSAIEIENSGLPIY